MLDDICHLAGCPAADDPEKKCDPISCGTLNEKSDLYAKSEFLIVAATNNRSYLIEEAES